MSFSSEVKEELKTKTDTAKHCQIAEFAAMMAFGGHIHTDTNKKYTIVFVTENETVAAVFTELAAKIFGITENEIIKDGLQLIIRDEKYVKHILMTLKWLTDDNLNDAKRVFADPLIVQKDCCKRAFIKGAFLTAGSISDPNKFYHFEVVCDSNDDALQLQSMMTFFNLDAKITARKKNYIWRVLLLVTAVGVALLPVIAWNMFVPDVLWAKIVTVVVCEGYVVFIVSMEIIQIKDELKEDMLKIGGYKITPKGSISLFKEIDFKIAQTEYSYTILISKKPLKWLYKKFYVTIYGRHGKVKKIELVRADKKYSTKYETMNGTVLEKLQEENNRFLRKCLGTPSKKSMTGVEYYYEWGQIQSFYDDRSCQTGIVIMF